MSDNHLSTDPYKGVRDFYPEDMTVQRYIFDVWTKTAESFGYERYDASILEPSDLYRAKGALNAEMVNEQTYTFIDRGEREVTLRTEMTPTAARMIAKRRRELMFPVRWYSIPNLFRYERPQRGRLREHWQLNCDLFGVDSLAADVEIIALAYQTLINFGATRDMFVIRVNDRKAMTNLYRDCGVSESDMIAITRLNDRKTKISTEDYQNELSSILKDNLLTQTVLEKLNNDTSQESPLLSALNDLGITNVVYDKFLARGFDYYTGTIFEIFDTSGTNNRSLMGGGRYDNLTSLFGGEPIPGVGFGLGDVIMRDFLETHNLLAGKIRLSAPTIVMIPTSEAENLAAINIANSLRAAGFAVRVDIGTKKIGKKISEAALRQSPFIMVVGDKEISSDIYTIKELASGMETSSDLKNLISWLQTKVGS